MSGSMTSSQLIQSNEERAPTELLNYYRTKIEENELILREKMQNLRRLEAQRNEWNSKGNLILDLQYIYQNRNLTSERLNIVRNLREELQLLQEPGSYVGEVVKVMGKSKILVKVSS